MSGKVIKTLSIVLLSVFFLIAGRISLSLAANTLFHDSARSTTIIQEPITPLPEQPKETEEEPRDDAERKDWGDNPFRNLEIDIEEPSATEIAQTDSTTQEIDLHLVCISSGRNGSFAVINDRILALGEEIEGFVLKRIEKNFVVLEREGQASILKIWEGAP